MRLNKVQGGKTVLVKLLEATLESSLTQILDRFVWKTSASSRLNSQLPMVNSGWERKPIKWFESRSVTEKVSVFAPNPCCF